MINLKLKLSGVWVFYITQMPFRPKKPVNFYAAKVAGMLF